MTKEHKTHQNHTVEMITKKQDNKMEKTKKQYVCPEITVIEVEPEHILAGSGEIYNPNDAEDWTCEFE